jgi:hypothetical protein
MLKIGDKVTVAVLKENREWGYNPAPDGTTGEVIGFSEIDYGRTNGGREPGIYANKYWPKVRLETGEENFINMMHLSYDKNRLWEEPEKLRDLPEFPFWEGDIVRVPSRSDEDLKIVRINYLGGWDSTYRVGIPDGWDFGCADHQIELVERGNVWKYYHNEPVTFTDLKEEASFFLSLGKAKEVRNPKTVMYAWTKDEAIQAIRDGVADAMVAGQVIGFPAFDEPRLSLYKFDDAELGRRLAAKLLANWG